jgi:hypothetical protein
VPVGVDGGYEKLKSMVTEYVPEPVQSPPIAVAGRVVGNPAAAIVRYLDQYGGTVTHYDRQLRHEAEDQARSHGRELGAAGAVIQPKAA